MTDIFKSDLIQSDRLRRLVPAALKTALKRHVPFAEYRSEQLRREAERRLGSSIPMASDYDSEIPVKLGILFDSSYTFNFNVAACRDLGLRYEVIDLSASNWIERVQHSGCEGFLAAPSTLRKVWHRIYEERLWVLNHDLRLPIWPSFAELYLWESKRRMYDWLVAYDVPHPKTWVFQDLAQARSFSRAARYPLVAKLDSGAASNGIFTVRDRQAADSFINRVFSKGILARGTDAREAEFGSVLFQEYVPHDFEWRVVRIGESYFCRRKVRIYEHASGSGKIGWAKPLPGMLDFAREVTERGGFTHMTVDMFENPRPGDPLLVNEMQAIVGFRDVPETQDMGRWLHDKSQNQWTFEPGVFHQNACANLRVQHALSQLPSENES